MKKEEIKDTVLDSKLFNFTISPNVLMWELELEDADFPIKHTVYLYVNHEGTHLVGGYLSCDLAADKNITENQLFNYPIVDLTRVRLFSYIDLLTEAKYEMIKKEKEYLVNENLQKIQEDFK